MKISELRPGAFFEFKEPGYCFGRCLWLGIDQFGALNFVHLSASGARYIHNDVVQFRDPQVTADVPQSWESASDYVLSGKPYRRSDGKVFQNGSELTLHNDMWWWDAGCAVAPKGLEENLPIIDLNPDGSELTRS